jgi:hypothetical protein
MKPTILMFFVLALAGSNFAVGAALNCNIDKTVPYKAELGGSGDGRSVTVVFNKRPSLSVANKIVGACMQVVINSDPAHELLGSAWVGETQFVLAPGKENLAYFPKEGRIRPFGLDEAIKNLKRK